MWISLVQNGVQTFMFKKNFKDKDQNKGVEPC